MPYMSVTLDVSKLSGWLNADAPCGVGGGIVDRRTQRQGVTKELAGRIRVWGEVLGMPGAHIKHAVHGCDFGRVETQRLVERRRALRCRGRDCGSENTAARSAQGDRGVYSGGWRFRACPERTENISCMVVTLDVSQLEISALKFFKL
eukprot:scaffold6018_cov51-Phaeocystis_antarctica.AAC.4